MDGKGLKRILIDPEAKVHDHLYFELGYARGVRTEQWKYIAIRYSAERFRQIHNASLEKLPSFPYSETTTLSKWDVWSRDSSRLPDVTAKPA